MLDPCPGPDLPPLTTFATLATSAIMLAFANYSTFASTSSTLPSDISFAMSTPSAQSVATTVCSSEVASVKGPRRAYKRLLLKLSAGLNTLKLKSKKMKEPATGGQLALVAADAPAEKFGRPSRAIVLPDAYYGWEHAARISAKFITTLFDCPSTLPGTSPDDEYPDLAQFIAYALFLCQLGSDVNDYAICLLWRMKAVHPGVKLAHGHGMYLAALSLAAKVVAREDFSSEDWAMIGQWIFSFEKLQADQQALGELLSWELEFGAEEMATIVEQVQRGEQPDADPIHMPTHFDDGDADSIHSISTSSSLSTCSINSAWSLRSMRGWDESARENSAVRTAPGEKVNTNPYPDFESWRSLPALNVLERFGSSSSDSFGD